MPRPPLNPSFYRLNGDVCYPSRVGYFEAVCKLSHCITSKSATPKCKPESVNKCAKCQYELEYCAATLERDAEISAELKSMREALGLSP